MLVDTPRALATALDCGAAVEDVLAVDLTDPVLERAAAAGASIAAVGEATLRSVAEVVHPQGIVASVRFAVRTVPLDGARLVVVIDGVGEPGNVGAIVRTAAAVAADGVVTTVGTADPTQPRAVRASAGALFGLPVEAAAEPATLFERLTVAGLSVVVADASGDDELPPAGQPTALVVGGEASGPSPAARRAADRLVGLPMHPPVESLNVAVSAGVLLYRLADRDR